MTFAIRPRYVAADQRMELGFAYAEVSRPVSAGRGAALAVSGLWAATEQTVSAVARIFEPRERQQMHGVIGSYRATQESFATSTSLAFEVLALISLSLGVINLFPLLPLDGGHIFWALAEQVTGKRVDYEVMERAGAVGVVLIAIVFVIGLRMDISSLNGGGFDVR